MLVSLTDAGRRLRGEIERVWQELERLSTAHLSENEREQLLRLLESVEAHVRPAGTAGDEAPSAAQR
jgi:DNA-binding MarR family transcriptional regulator